MAEIVGQVNVKKLPKCLPCSVGAEGTWGLVTPGHRNEHATLGMSSNHHLSLALVTVFTRDCLLDSWSP
jgi:hypothetical protein